jgi:hypothetical protein
LLGSSGSNWGANDKNASMRCSSKVFLHGRCKLPNSQSNLDTNISFPIARQCLIHATPASR